MPLWFTGEFSSHLLSAVFEGSEDRGACLICRDRGHGIQVPAWMFPPFLFLHLDNHYVCTSVQRTLHVGSVFPITPLPHCIRICTLAPTRDIAQITCLHTMHLTQLSPPQTSQFVSHSDFHQHRRNAKVKFTIH